MNSALLEYKAKICVNDATTSFEKSYNPRTGDMYKVGMDPGSKR